ncbi:hypothetical protein RhiirA1_448150 [Rhizophagus irregularis]|uniref:Uncharacterized protein n=1 Tax=Rhizophagus irregularis TaxID=588596 RepID=A0A2N0SK62_9GLOM|nr:hypothetical protein RhiirA1_448150 [Rhizophagus irregularis]
MISTSLYIIIQEQMKTRIKEKLDADEQCVSILQKSEVKGLMFDKLWDKKIKTAMNNVSIYSNGNPKAIMIPISNMTTSAIPTAPDMLINIKSEITEIIKFASKAGIGLCICYTFRPWEDINRIMEAYHGKIYEEIQKAQKSIPNLFNRK